MTNIPRRRLSDRRLLTTPPAADSGPFLASPAVSSYDTPETGPSDSASSSSCDTSSSSDSGSSSCDTGGN